MTTTNATAGKRFADRVVIITGASSGFGLAIARAFAAEGAKAVLAARNTEHLREAAAQIEAGGGQALAVACDVAKPDQVEALVSKTIAQFKRVDILVNNAGSGLIAPFEQVQLPDAKTLFDVNFFGPFHCVQAVLPHMKRQHTGHIIIMASFAGLRAIPNSSIYSASKAALIALSDALRLEVEKDGIAVTALCPSRASDTSFVRNAKTYGPVRLYDIPQPLDSATVARAALHAVITRKPMVIIPFYARLMHNLNKLAPRLIDRLLQSRMPERQLSHDRTDA